MKYGYKICGTALASIFMAQAAFADVTSDQVWQSLKNYYTSSGYTVTAGGEVKDGKTLRLKDISISQKSDDVDMTLTVPELTLTEKSGKVSVTVPAESPYTVKTRARGGEPVSFGLLVTQKALDIVVSGSPDDMTYDYSAGQVSVALSNLMIDEKPAAVTGDFNLRDSKGDMRIRRNGDTITTTQSGSTEKIDFAIAASVPDSATGESVEMNAKGSMDDIVASGAFTGPEKGFDPEALNDALKTGLSMNATIGYGPTAITFGGTDKQGVPFTGALNTKGGEYVFAMSDKGIKYDSSGKAADFSFTSDKMPAAISFSLDSAAANLLMPVTRTAGDAPEDFGLVTRLVGLKLSDDIWALIDAQGILKHDPATLIVDLSGKARLLVDIFAKDTATQEDIPGELHSLDLNALELTVAGASLTGKGGFTFDNSDKVTFQGMPRPEGSVSLRLLGGNALLDNLVTMGIVPQEQLMGVRMMMGAFTKAGPGADELNSTVEVRKDGGLYANGQRLK